MKEGGFDLSSVYGFGEKVAQSIGWTPQLDLFELIKCNGGTIHFIDYESFNRNQDIFENSIYVRKKNDFDIILPAYASMIENRFTLAHELGHYVLHSRFSGKSFACRNGDTAVEKEADCFALGFMMPANHFRRACETYKSTYDLSVFFLVPIEAVLARKKSLALM